MTMPTPSRSLVSLAAVLALAACTTGNARAPSYGGGTTYPQSTNSHGRYAGYGIVQSIELVRQDDADNRVSAGRGNTVAGAAGGASGGHELEKRNHQPSEAYRFTIRMEDGSHETLMQSSNGDIRVGDRVELENGVLQRN